LPPPGKTKPNFKKILGDVRAQLGAEMIREFVLGDDISASNIYIEYRGGRIWISRAKMDRQQRPKEVEENNNKKCEKQ
jgi:hypothetical protein